MTEIGEMVAVVAFGDEQWKCPFSHRARTDAKSNHIPPPTTKNDSGKLGDNLAAEDLRLDDKEISVKGKKHYASFSPHHVIPGNEAWPKSDLFDWIDGRGAKVNGDIGYDVNAASNGIDLPAQKDSVVPNWTSSGPGFQKDYAFASMAADRKMRQFHDRHPAYSDFVIQTLNKIAAKLNGPNRPGCGKKNCGGGAAGPKYDPPYRLLGRLDVVALRLKLRLRGTSKEWKKPVMTSRFALMFKNKWMTQNDAREELKVDQFDYDE